MKKIFRLSYITILASALLVTSCTNEPTLASDESSVNTKTILKTGKSALSGGTKKLLIIGIDGCRGDALMGANTPNVHALLPNSVYSLDALTEAPTWSGNGWSTMLS